MPPVMPLGGGGEGGGKDPQMEACVQPNAAHNSAGPVAEGLRLKTAAAAVREGIQRERERERPRRSDGGISQR